MGRRYEDLWAVDWACQHGIGRADSRCALAADVPPNVVILLSDDQAWTDYGFMGHPQIQTPHLDKLAAQSLVFTRGYTPTSLCRASLMTIITGQYPQQHLVTGNDPPKGTDRSEMLQARPPRCRRCRSCWPNRAMSAFRAANGGKATSPKAASPPA